MRGNNMEVEEQVAHSGRARSTAQKGCAQSLAHMIFAQWPSTEAYRKDLGLMN
jgi:hypothetical protein